MCYRTVTIREEVMTPKDIGHIIRQTRKSIRLNQSDLALTLEDEMTHREAGDVLGVSEGTISWRMAEVKKHLRVMHEEEQKA